MPGEGKLSPAVCRPKTSDEVEGVLRPRAVDAKRCVQADSSRPLSVRRTAWALSRSACGMLASIF
eukprot:6468247-Amphidinium_carterae.2